MKRGVRITAGEGVIIDGEWFKGCSPEDWLIKSIFKDLPYEALFTLKKKWSDKIKEGDEIKIGGSEGIVTQVVLDKNRRPKITARLDKYPERFEVAGGGDEK